MLWQREEKEFLFCASKQESLTESIIAPRHCILKHPQLRHPAQQSEELAALAKIMGYALIS
jgi:hypothetical protein